MARKTPVRAKKLSLVKRFGRFLNNAAVRVRDWYRPFAEGMLAAASVAGQVHLILDTTKVAFCFRLLMVSVAYRGRSLPVAWTWVAGRQGHTTTATQIRLLTYVTELLPCGTRVSLVGDCEFGNPLLVEYVQGWGWEYALRQPGDHLVMLKGTGRWQRIDSLPLGQGQPVVGQRRLDPGQCTPDAPGLVLAAQREAALVPGDELARPARHLAPVSASYVD